MPDANALSEFASNEKATNEAIAHLGALYPALPETYMSFLMDKNGGEGFVGDDYVILWRADEIERFNREYEVSIYAPTLLLFGSNGGGEAYAFDTREGSWSVVRVPFIGMDLKYAVPLARSFTEFLEVLAKKL
jgi:hypothetical protein